MRAAHTRRGQAVNGAPTPVRRARGNPLRRHWLTGALVAALAGLLSFGGMQLYQAQLELKQALAVQAQVEAELRALQEKNRRLSETLQRVTSFESMELKAKQLGFVWPEEQVFQTAPPDPY
ncbi:MAG: septum formation initiator family protein [Symbiobacterium sp.]|uniref:septum formation initiator family protein n=1 Tax=Symbiobacterium sp. TaxID=1971213 RepID=UPI0034649253